ncbi:metastasis-associated protein MTA3 isoform X2 [Aplysia californica]|uniref:Metastasis-associated protein MTA3 isoform X2 n=1 Tax=Aplysia californica TaxID=6500 RepID=A0ABM0JGY4_APLCA|nr:metastasis-associated protein MTA3 isoform X2 [Aplysia californica]
MSANMYRVGDYVFFETSSTAPYQIRRIEELNKTQNGNVEAKVMCFYRRRDISNSLIILADKHHNALDEEGEEKREIDDELAPKPDGETNGGPLSPAKDPVEENGTENNSPTNGSTNNNNNHQAGVGAGGLGMEEIPEKLRHQLKHRELFLSRQVETLPATHIRGKCCVTLLNETESLLSYLNKDDTFFYSLVYDPQQKTLLADKGEIRVGSKYQAEMIPKLSEGEGDVRKSEDLEELVWDPLHGLSEKEIDQFQIIARSVGTFARALDCTSTVRQPSLHMSAAAASRDITIFHAMNTLHQHKYNIAKAIQSLVPSGGPVLCRDEMEEWSASEANLFEDAIEQYGKDFNGIRQDFLPWKSLKSIVEYYYMWKTTDRYVQQKRIKASEAESKLKQVYIPNYNKPNPAAITNKLNGADGQVSGRACESCYTAHSNQWYSWGPVHMQCRLCSNCWSYWKKYGGLKMPTRLDGERPAPNQRQERIAQMNSIRMQKCTFTGCGKEFKLKAHLNRHMATSHGMPIQPGSPRPVMKTRAAFCLVTTELTRISRRLCRDLLRPRHATRCPFTPINTSLIKQECQLRLSERPSYQQPAKYRTPATLDPVVARLGIDIKQEKPSLLLKGPNYGGGDRSSTPKERPQENVKVGSGHPSIMKKRGYEQTNGVDSGPAAKRPNMGVIRQAGTAIKTPGVTRRGSVLNHNSVNGRSRFCGKSMRMQLVGWMDNPDDVYFVATAATRKIRKQLQMNDFKRLARNPWKTLNVKPPLPSGSLSGSNGHRPTVPQEVVVLD